VVNDYAARYAAEIYNYHKTNGLVHMQFIPCVERDPMDPARAAPYSVNAEAYGRFLCELFDLWSRDFRLGRPTTSIRWFDSVFYSYVGYDPPECTLLQECGIYVVIEHNGDVFCCDFFVDPEWRLGNVKTDRLVDLLNSPLQNRFGAAKKSLPAECPDCPWLRHCHGGCPKDRMGDPRDRGSNHFCRSYMMFFDHADERLRRLAENWQAEQNREGKTEMSVAAAGRNAPCPCGSGKKFKKCCGK
jgi:uncharacterized protein